MTLRSKSRWQWFKLVLAAALVAVDGYVILSRILCGSEPLCGFSPVQQRICLPILVLFFVFVWETRWDGVKRTKSKSVKSGARQELPTTTAEGVAPAPEDTASEDSPSTTDDFAALPATAEPAAPATPSASVGEELYAQARAMPHRQIPSFATDKSYLELLGMAAAQGYAPALAKLGEYALRRSALVEAYYWMWMANRKGKGDAASALREIRKQWALSGFPTEPENVHELFDEECSSIGLALLDIDAKHNAHIARQFLESSHPEFLEVER